MSHEQSALVELPRCCNRRGFTYVLSGADKIKIGSAGSVSLRLKLVESYSPVPISLIGVARGRTLERWIHDKCARHRMHGEWFSRDAWQEVEPLFGGLICASCMIAANDNGKVASGAAPNRSPLRGLNIAARRKSCVERHWTTQDIRLGGKS